MTEGRISRLIKVHSAAARIEDGVELRTSQDLPEPWGEGDMIAVDMPTNASVMLIAEPNEGADVFSYKPNSYSTWHIQLERLSPDNKGHRGLRVRFDEHHRYLQAQDDADGR